MILPAGITALSACRIVADCAASGNPTEGRRCRNVQVIGGELTCLRLQEQAIGSITPSKNMQQAAADNDSVCGGSVAAASMAAGCSTQPAAARVLSGLTILEGNKDLASQLRDHTLALTWERLKGRFCLSDEGLARCTSCRWAMCFDLLQEW